MPVVKIDVIIGERTLCQRDGDRLLLASLQIDLCKPSELLGRFE